MTLMQRASMGYSSGLLTLNQALEIVDLPPESRGKGGNERKEISQPFGEKPENPDRNESKGGGDPKNE